MRRRRQKRTVESVEESWSVVRGSYEGQPLLARINAGYTEAVDRADYPIQIGVAIPVNSPDEQGWPSADENLHLQDVEAAAVRTAGDRAVLVAVLTVNGVRELVFYTRDPAWIEQFDHQLQESTATHEIQVMARRDPGWSVFDQFAVQT